MGNSILGTIGILILAVIMYIIVSGAASLSKQEKIVSAVWVLLLLVLSSKLI